MVSEQVSVWGPILLTAISLSSFMDGPLSTTCLKDHGVVRVCGAGSRPNVWPPLESCRLMPTHLGDLPKCPLHVHAPHDGPAVSRCRPDWTSVAGKRQPDLGSPEAAAACRAGTFPWERS